MMTAMTTVAPAAGPALAPDDPRISTWRDFLLAHARLQRILDNELRSEHDISLAEYDALLVLAAAQNRRLRMHQIADQVLYRLDSDGQAQQVSRNGTIRSFDAGTVLDQAFDAA